MLRLKNTRVSKRSGTGGVEMRVGDQGRTGGCILNWIHIFPRCSLQPGTNPFFRHKGARLLNAAGISVKPYKGNQMN